MDAQPMAARAISCIRSRSAPAAGSARSSPLYLPPPKTTARIQKSEVNCFPVRSGLGSEEDEGAVIGPGGPPEDAPQDALDLVARRLLIQEQSVMGSRPRPETMKMARTAGDKPPP